ncbi:hypothetical protein MOQ_002210, partial [Trypanosoma cruzi marinkellei]
MRWCALNMNEGRTQLDCFCDEYWLRFPWTNNPRGVRGSNRCCFIAFVLLWALHLFSFVCVRTLREGCGHDGPLSPYVHAVEPCVPLLFTSPSSICVLVLRQGCVCVCVCVCLFAVAAGGVAAVSLLLLPPCVDGELVCAEGCMQVTGVMMAMMMTGRVLLVCALCVLWCGAGCGGCDETPRASPPDSAGGGAGGEQAQSLQTSDSSRLGGDTGTAGLNPTEDGGTVPSPQPPTASPTETSQGLNTRVEEAREPAPPLESSPVPSLPAKSSPPSSQSVSTSLTEILPKTENLPKPVVQGDSENSSTTTESQSAEHLPSQSQLPAEGTGTETTTVTAAPSPVEGPDNSTEETDSGGPEGEEEGTQESQPLKGNETETPTTATVTAAQTNATMMLGDSDGSSAPSHTNSPLFPFFYSCVCGCCCGGGRVRAREREP